MSEMQNVKKDAPVLSVRDLSVAFGGKVSTRRCFPKFWKKFVETVPALQVTDRVSFEIFPGEFFALVGESGCGKSVTAMSILRLLPYPSAKIVEGEVMFESRTATEAAATAVVAGDATAATAACSAASNATAVASGDAARSHDAEKFAAGKAAAATAFVAGNAAATGNVAAAGCIDLTKVSLADLQKVRGSEIACIFQEPMQALNPVVTIKKQLLEVFKFGASRLCEKNAPRDCYGGEVAGAASCARDSVMNSDSHKSASSNCESENCSSQICNKDASHAEEPLTVIREQLLAAGFKDPERVLNSYPHELSGGMLQRVCIVMALLPKPKLIIADEPTTALDVTVQAQVLKVLKDMAEKTGTAVLLITHNMGIVSEYAHRVAVMYAGRIVECGPVRDVINCPMHPYTQGLLAAIPESHSDLRTLCSIPGSVPHPKDFVAGCRFADRCSLCSAECKKETLPPKVGSAMHFANCFKGRI